MADISEQNILNVLGGVSDPESGKDVVSLGMVKGVQIKDGHVAFALEVDPARGEAMEPVRKAAEQAVHAMPGVLTATVVLTAERPSGQGNGGAHPQQGHGHAHGHDHGHDHGHGHSNAGIPGASDGRDLLPGVSALIAVASGKGGVGKSTTAVNLAMGLRRQGLKVGILDADIYGPSLPRMMGITGKPASPDGKRIDPMENHGVKVMSMGFLVEEDTPMIWRGPMVQSALEQMMRDVNWGNLDVLIIDMPPGTGDAQLTMAQRVPLTGAVIVSTPQDIALLDARKGLNMFRKVNVPVFGIVENMSYFACPKCGERTEIFGHGGARKTAESMGTDFLGEIPLHIDIRTNADAGTPIVISKPDSEHAKAYCDAAAALWERAEVELNRARGASPRIVME
ncbi:MAG: iron-sulfur cluster carrier protein ApbC [Rhodospirillales bacterium]